MTYTCDKHSFQMFAKDYDCEQEYFVLFCDSEAFACEWYGPDNEWTIHHIGKACEANVWCSVTEDIQEVDINGQFRGYIRDMINHINFDILRCDCVASYCKDDPVRS